MGSFSLNGAFTALNDPDYQTFGLIEVGAFLNGKPVRMGYESGILRFPPCTTGAFNELVARWNANKNSQVSGAIPAISGYGWRAVSAYWHEPQMQGFDGPIVNGVTMIVSKIGNY